MLQFFTKRKYLVDYLNGFVDIHNHILPGIDDGARTVEDSLILIRGLLEFGLTNYIATPHIMHNYYDNDADTISAAMEVLKNELIKNDLKQISIEASAEHMIDDRFELLLEHGEVMPMRNDYLLVEMSFLQASINFDEAIKKVLSAGYFPILAHPERYNYLAQNKEFFEEYKKLGVLMQLNILSLSDYYGKETKKQAHNLLEHGYIDFIATDIHHLNHLSYLKQSEISQKTLDLILPVMENTITRMY